MPTLTCPQCSLARNIDAAKLAPRQLKVRCTRCKSIFSVDGRSLLGLDSNSLELDWGGRTQPSERADLPQSDAGEPVAIPPDPVYEPVLPVADPAALPWGEGVQTGDRLSPKNGSSDRFGYDNPWTNALALPIALVVSVLAKLLVLPGILLDWMRAWLHEFGHAIPSWLSSHAATPLALLPGLAWASTNPKKSAWVFVCFLFLIGVVGYRALRTGSRFLLAIASTLFVLQIVSSFMLSRRTAEIVMVFSGAGGELVLGTLLVVGFYHRLPDRIRWDFFRFVALLVGTYAVGTASLTWIRARHDPRAIPWGTGWGGRGDEGGDMQRLVAFGWSTDRLTASYLTIAAVCGALIAGHYVWFLWHSRRTAR